MPLPFLAPLGLLILNEFLNNERDREVYLEQQRMEHETYRRQIEAKERQVQYHYQLEAAKLKVVQEKMKEDQGLVAKLMEEALNRKDLEALKLFVDLSKVIATTTPVQFMQLGGYDYNSMPKESYQKLQQLSTGHNRNELWT